jgi:hypothetical protein
VLSSSGRNSLPNHFKENIMARIQRQFIVIIEGEQDDLEDMEDGAIESAISDSPDFPMGDATVEVRFAGELVHRDDQDDYRERDDD